MEPLETSEGNGRKAVNALQISHCAVKSKKYLLPPAPFEMTIGERIAYFLTRGKMYIESVIIRVLSTLVEGSVAPILRKP